MPKILSFSNEFYQILYKRFQVLQKLRLIRIIRQGFDLRKDNFHLNSADKTHWTKISHFAQLCSGSIVANFVVILKGEPSDVVQFLDMQLKRLPSSINGLKVTPGTFSSGNSLVFLSIHTVLCKMY